MTSQRDLDRRLMDYLDQGPTMLPTGRYDAVRDDIDHTRQRVAVGRWGERQLLKYVTFAVAAAAVLLIAVVGIRFLPSDGGFGVQPTPSPSPTPVPDPEGHLEPGFYVAHPFANDSRGFAITVSTENWGSSSDPGQMRGLASRTENGREAALGFLRVESLNGNPCKWSGDADDVVVGPTVDDLITALASSTDYDATEPVATVVGGFSGKQIRLTMPATGFAERSSEAIDCHDAKFRIWNAEGFDIYAQGPTNIWDLNIVDAEGDRLVILASYFPDTPAAAKSDLQQMVDSVQISP